MSFNVQTKTQWAVGGPAEQEAALGKQNFLEMNEARTQWLDSAVTAEKTDKLVTEDGIRNWDSEQSANEFKTFIEGLGEQYGLEVAVTIL